MLCSGEFFLTPTLRCQFHPIPASQHLTCEMCGRYYPFMIDPRTKQTGEDKQEYCRCTSLHDAHRCFANAANAISSRHSPPTKVPCFEIRRRGWGGGWKPGPLKQWKWWPNTETLGLHHLPQFHNVALASLTTGFTWCHDLLAFISNISISFTWTR